MHRDIRDEFILWAALLAGLLATCSLFAGEPMSLEQLETKRLLEEKADEYTFIGDPTQVGQYSTGYVKPITGLFPTSEPIKLGDDKPLKSWNLKSFGRELNPVLNQGNCGSCVIFAFSAVVMDLFLMRDLKIDHISMQHYMNCSSGSQCGGAYGEEIADDAVRLGKNGGFYKNADYPYTARSGKCQVKEGKDKTGIIKSWKTIDGSVKSLLAALHNGQGVAVGVAANGAFQSYRSGIYNACNSDNINHYVYLQGIDCGSSVDTDGNCKFDEDGNLPDGVGTFHVRNSWGRGWGEEGYIRMAITSKGGSRCNGLAKFKGDAQVLDMGLPIPPPRPSEFVVESNQVVLKVKMKDVFTSDEALKESLKNALDALESK